MKSVAQMSIHFINIYCAPTVCQVRQGLTPGNGTKRVPSAKPTGNNSYHLLRTDAVPSNVLSILQSNGLPARQLLRSRNHCPQLRHGVSNRLSLSGLRGFPGHRTFSAEPGKSRAQLLRLEKSGAECN